MPFLYLCRNVAVLAKATQDHAEKWAPIKEAQKEVARDLEYVAYSCSIDLGYAVDVHPREKTMYAKRAADATLHDFFGVGTTHFPYVESIEKTASDTATEQRLSRPLRAFALSIQS